MPPDDYAQSQRQAIDATLLMSGWGSTLPRMDEAVKLYHAGTR
jgi:hypothetical protein